jgi:glycerophosphoryl diester phosphodiesterase
MLNLKDVDLEGVRELRKAGIRVFSSTANSADAWRAYLRLGMDGILTDDPESFIEFLKGSGTGE